MSHPVDVSLTKHHLYVGNDNSMHGLTSEVMGASLSVLVIIPIDLIQSEDPCRSVIM